MQLLRCWHPCQNSSANFDAATHVLMLHAQHESSSCGSGMSLYSTFKRIPSVDTRVYIL
eukprot:m.80895 g.80895  ORF g.80895 m.80895 type:complete len:59 (+) comp10948_c0_seq1:1462-1638(+)